MDPSADDCFRDSIAAGKFILQIVADDSDLPEIEALKLRHVGGKGFWECVEELLTAIEGNEYSRLAF
jgi:hypothetical protein